MIFRYFPRPVMCCVAGFAYTYIQRHRNEEVGYEINSEVGKKT